jgi:hypothetical protein
MQKSNDTFKEPYSTKPSNMNILNDSQINKNKNSKSDNSINLKYFDNLIDAKDKNIEIEMQNLLKSSSKYNK